MTATPTNDGTGQPYKVIGINSKAWVEHPDGRRDDFGDDLNRALLVASKMNLAHAAREPEIAELREDMKELSADQEEIHRLLDWHYNLDPNTTAMETLLERITKYMGERDEEHKSRVKYQDFAYDVLNLIDGAEGRSVSKGTGSTIENGIGLLRTILSDWKAKRAEIARLTEEVDAQVATLKIVETQRDCFERQLSACERERDEARRQLDLRRRLLDKAATWHHDLTAKLRKAEEALEYAEKCKHCESCALVARRALTALRTPSGEGEMVLTPEGRKTLKDFVSGEALPKPTAPCCPMPARKMPPDPNRGVTMEPASEPAPPPTPPAFKARRWVSLISKRCEWETKPDGSVWFVNSETGATAPSSETVADLEEKAGITVREVPTPKEEVCDSGSGSSASGVALSISAEASDVATAVSPSDPPATRDAGEGPVSLDALAAAFGLLEEVSLGLVGTLHERANQRHAFAMRIARTMDAYAAGRASVSPAPHAEFVAAAVKVLTNRLHKLRGGEPCGCAQCGDIRAALALAPACAREISPNP